MSLKNGISLIIFSCFCMIFNSLNANPLSIELKKGWKFKQANLNEWHTATVPGEVHTDLLNNKLIEDPFYRLNEHNLQWIDKVDWVYETTFNISTEFFNKENLELDFKGLDTFTDVYLNDQKVLSTDNMFLEWIIDVKKAAKAGQNTLRIYFHSPIQKGLKLLKEYGFKLQAVNDQSQNGDLTSEQLVSPFIRKAPYHFGWDWGPRFVTSGIWKPVYVRAWNCLKINDFYVAQEKLTKNLANLKGLIEIKSDKNQQVLIEILNEGSVAAKKSVSLKVGINAVEIPFDVKNPKLWWTNGLGKPNLYTFNVKVSSSQTADNKSCMIGLRTLKLIQKQDSIGHSFYFELNGIPVFAKGENHIPNDIFLNRVTKEIYDWEIQTAVQSNLNMLRVWGGGIYENDYFYELCDQNGILVWQDFMFACSLYPGNEAFLNSVTKEADYQVRRLRNHPSIALWCGNNEIDVALQPFNPNGGWGWLKAYDEKQKKKVCEAYDTIFNHILANTVHILSPQTPYWQSSPSSIVPQKYATNNNPDGDVHYWGVWWGKDPFEKFADNIGRFMSEYGFQSFPELESIKKFALPEDYNIESEVMRSHQKSSIGNVTIKEYMNMYYRTPKTFEKFLYVGQVLQAYGIQFAIESHRRAMPYNMGSIVWQINDCWPVASWSSCDYYHRWKALQYEIKHSFEPIIITASKNNDKTSITVVSDKLTDISSELELKVSDFKGNILQIRKLPVLIRSNAVNEILIEETNKLTTNVDDTYMLLTLNSKTGILAQKIYCFAQPKSLNLIKPVIISTVEKQDSIWKITLKSDVFAKAVYLNYSGVEGFFSDNYFDLLPGVDRVITFTPKEKSAKLSKLEIISLVDSYME